jgi:hypothetical protein
VTKSEAALGYLYLFIRKAGISHESTALESPTSYGECGCTETRLRGEDRVAAR